MAIWTRNVICSETAFQSSTPEESETSAPTLMSVIGARLIEDSGERHISFMADVEMTLSRIFEAL